MKKLIYTFAVLILTSLTTQLYGQDIIKQKNGEELEVRIVEQADDYIVYYHIDDPNQVEVKMNRSLIREIRYEYGRKEAEVAPGEDESYFVDDRRNNIKLNFSAIAGAATILTYERSLDPKSSWEGGIAIHGAGVNNDAEKSGFGVNAAYKVKFGSLFKKDEYRPKHVLDGTYLRPNLGYNNISYDNPGFLFEPYDKTSYVYGGVDLGKQWILNNSLLLDLYAGLAYYGGNFERPEGFDCEFCDDFDDIEIDGNLAGGNNVAGRFGIQVGFLFDNKK